MSKLIVQKAKAVEFVSNYLISLQVRSYASEGRRGFLGGLLDNIKQELAKNKEMKDSIKKFRDEAKRLEESDALQSARKKYVSFF